jgi:hypothetical protein
MKLTFLIIGIIPVIIYFVLAVSKRRCPSCGKLLARQTIGEKTLESGWFKTLKIKYTYRCKHCRHEWVEQKTDFIPSGPF